MVLTVRTLKVKLELSASSTDAAAALAPVAGSADTTELVTAVGEGPAANTADDMELCSTAELLELVNDYYEADVEASKTDFLVSQSFAHGEIDFEHAALTNPGVASAPVALRAQLGAGNADCNIENLISRD